MAGILTYLSIFLLMGVWVLAWSGIAALSGTFFDLPMSTSSLLGALLGPIGFIAVILLGITNKSPSQIFKSNNVEKKSVSSGFEDPFQ